MRFLKAYKYRIYPNQSQRISFAQHFGCARFIYNWSLDYSNKFYKENDKSISAFDVMKKVAELKKQD